MKLGEDGHRLQRKIARLQRKLARLDSTHTRHIVHRTVGRFTFKVEVVGPLRAVWHQTSVVVGWSPMKMTQQKSTLEPDPRVAALAEAMCDWAEANYTLELLAEAAQQQGGHDERT